jgi:hypothetical protein
MPEVSFYRTSRISLIQIFGRNFVQEGSFGCQKWQIVGLKFQKDTKRILVPNVAKWKKSFLKVKKIQKLWVEKTKF